jgi:hypothetical protein
MRVMTRTARSRRFRRATKTRLCDGGVDIAPARNSAEGGAVMPSARPSTTSIDTASCAASETVVVITRSSVYELVVLRGNCGEVLVRGGSRFKGFCPALFVGSIRNDGAPEPHTIDIGLRMKFYFDNLVIITSPVESLSRHLASATTTDCDATRCG